MSHNHEVSLSGTVGQILWLPVPDDTTGQVIGDYAVEVSTNGVRIADPVTDLSLALAEVDSVNLPGLYYVLVTPDRAGTLFVTLRRGGFFFEYTLTIESSVLADDASVGDAITTIEDGVGPVEGVLVSLYTSSGSLVTRVLTDSAGEARFDAIPVGDYEVRASKTAYDFSDTNPTALTVTPNSENAPVIDAVLPEEITEGETFVISGKFLSGTLVEVLFGAEATVAAESVNPRGTLLTVTVPAGLTSTIIALRVQKEDPNAAPAKLTSNILSVPRT